jgi:hypothetical protein
LNKDEKINKFMLEKVLGGNEQCVCAVDKSKSEFTRDEINAYREQQLQFREKIYGTSASPEDPVDKMNLITLQGGIKGNGQTISSFYDSLLK